MLGLTPTRRHDREMAAQKAETDRIRAERDKAIKDAAMWHASSSRTSELFADTSIVNDCLTRDLTRAHRQRDYARKAAERILAAWHTEKERADRLEALAGAETEAAIEAWEQRVKAHTAWRGPHDLEKRPVDGASARPLHPAVELLRTQDRCRALEVLLAKAEGRKPGVTL